MTAQALRQHDVRAGSQTCTVTHTPDGPLRHSATLVLPEPAIDEPNSVLLDITLQALAPVGDGPIRAEAVLLHGTVGRRVWKVVLRDAPGVLETILRDGITAGEFADVDTKTTAHLIESLCEAWWLRRFVMRRAGLAHVSALVQQLLAKGLRPHGSAA